METFLISPSKVYSFKNKWIAIYFSIENESGIKIQLRRKVKVLSFDESKGTISFLDGENQKFTWPVHRLDKISVIK